MNAVGIRNYICQVYSTKYYTNQQILLESYRVSYGNANNKIT